MIVATADWHCDEYAWASRPAVAGDSLCALTQITDFCVAQRATALLGAGDLYDTPDPSPVTQAAVHAQLDRLMEAEIPVYFIQGQHERHPRLPRLRVHPWPIHLDQQKTATADGISVYGLDWRPTGLLQDALAAIPEVDLLMCHQVWREHMGNLPSEGALAEIPANTNLVLTGDFHQHKFGEVPRGESAPLHVLSPGATHMRAIDEPATHEFFTIDQDLVIDSVPLVSRTFLRYQVRTADQLDRLLTADLPQLLQQAASRGLPAAIATALLVVDFDADAVGLAYPAITAACKGRCHLFLRPYRQQVEQRARPVGPARHGLPDYLDLAADPQSPVYGLAQQLLNSHDLAAELAGLRPC